MGTFSHKLRADWMGLLSENQWPTSLRTDIELELQLILMPIPCKMHCVLTYAGFHTVARETRKTGTGKRSIIILAICLFMTDVTLQLTIDICRHIILSAS